MKRLIKSKTAFSIKQLRIFRGREGKAGAEEGGGGVGGRYKQVQ